MSAAINDGGPAYPVQVKRNGYHTDKDGNLAVTIQSDTGFHEGMKLRDWFAGQALAGLMQDGWANSAVAKQAWGAADAMIAAREGRAK